MSTKFLCVSTADTRCTQAVKAKLPNDENTIVLRPTGKEPTQSIGRLARRSEHLIVVTGRGLRASRLLLATIRAAVRAGRPCLYLQHEDGLADRLVLPPSCEKQYYGSAAEAAALVVDFVSRGPSRIAVHPRPSLRVFAIDDGPVHWNEALEVSLTRLDVQRIYTADMRAKSIVKAAMQADVTIVLPSGRNRRWHRQTYRLMQLAIGACENFGKRSLHIRHFQARQLAGCEPPELKRCISAVCGSPADVMEAVDEFLDDAMTNVGLA